MVVVSQHHMAFDIKNLRSWIVHFITSSAATLMHSVGQNTSPFTLAEYHHDYNFGLYR
jgi:hypothetical protein